MLVDSAVGDLLRTAALFSVVSVQDAVIVAIQSLDHLTESFVHLDRADVTVTILIEVLEHIDHAGTSQGTINCVELLNVQCAIDISVRSAELGTTKSVNLLLSNRASTVLNNFCIMSGALRPR